MAHQKTLRKVQAEYERFRREEPAAPHTELWRRAEDAVAAQVQSEYERLRSAKPEAPTGQLWRQAYQGVASGDESFATKPKWPPWVAGVSGALFMSLVGGAVMVDLGGSGPQTDRILGFLSVMIVGAWLGIGVGTIGIAFTNRSVRVGAIVGTALWASLTLSYWRSG